MGVVVSQCVPVEVVRECCSGAALLIVLRNVFLSFLYRYSFCFFFALDLVFLCFLRLFGRSTV